MTWLQHWTDVLFVHFPVPRSALASRLHSQLEIDTFAGQAWLSYVFFRLKLRPRWLPFVPALSSLTELNVRTYVRYRGDPGICFLRMYADNRLAIRASKWLTPLCYERAAMLDTRDALGQRHVECRPANKNIGPLAIRYGVDPSIIPLATKTLDHWLLERYRLYLGLPAGGLLAADVHHAPWTAGTVQLSQFDDCLSPSLGLSPPPETLLAYHSPGVRASFQPFRTLIKPAGQTFFLPGRSAARQSRA